MNSFLLEDKKNSSTSLFIYKMDILEKIKDKVRIYHLCNRNWGPIVTYDEVEHLLELLEKKDGSEKR